MSRKPPAPLERDILRQCLDYLSLCPGVFVWRNNTGALNVGKRFVRFGTVGSSDKAFLDDSCELPRPLFVALHGRLLPHHAYYPCWDDAIDALVLALERLREITEVCS